MNKHLQSDATERNELVRIIHDAHHESLLFSAVGLCRRFKMDVFSANDLMQEFYYSVMARHDVVAKGYAAGGVSYLYKMLKNEVIDQGRKEKGFDRKEKMLAVDIPRPADIFSHCSEIHSEGFLEDMSRLLPDGDFQVMRLYIDGYSYEEIGESLDMNINTVGVRIHRAKKVLARHYDWKPRRKRSKNGLL